jgi:hypothetical protein
MDSSNHHEHCSCRCNCLQIDHCFCFCCYSSSHDYRGNRCCHQEPVLFQHSAPQRLLLAERKVSRATKASAACCGEGLLGLQGRGRPLPSRPRRLRVMGRRRGGPNITLGSEEKDREKQDESKCDVRCARLCNCISARMIHARLTDSYTLTDSMFTFGIPTLYVNNIFRIDSIAHLR